MFKISIVREKLGFDYDIGNSAYNDGFNDHSICLGLAANAGMSNSEYLAFWSYATSIATILLHHGPVFGSIADNKDSKKPLFMFVLSVSNVRVCLELFQTGFYLITYVIAKIRYQTSRFLSDSMLTDVTTPGKRMDLVSSAVMHGGLSKLYSICNRTWFIRKAGNPDFWYHE